MVTDLAMCPPRSMWRALIATKSGKTALLADKTKRRKRRKPGKPFGGIRLKGEQALFRADYHIVALDPIFHQRQNTRVFTSINRCRNGSFVQGRFRSFIQGSVLERLDHACTPLPLLL